MPTDVVMPQMGESITEGTLTKWLKQVGDTVARDEPLFEISTDKVDAEIPSPLAGVLHEIKVGEGSTVSINTVVAVLDAGSNGKPAAGTSVASYTQEVAPSTLSEPPATATGTDVPMPQMGESITEGTITKWLKKVGDSVGRDEPLFEISTDKVDAEIPSPAAGVLLEIKAQEGETVAINTIVAVIGSGASATEAAPAPQSMPSVQSTPAAAISTPQESSPVASPASIPAASAATEILMPQMGESITEGTITKWLKKVGDTVARDEPIFEISTDKVDAEIPSPAAGTLTEIRAQEGETVSINTVVAVLGGGAATTASAPATSPQASSQPVATTAAQASVSGETPRSSPLVRKIAKDNNIDLAAAGIPGSGAAGRVTKNDILGYMQSGSKATGSTPTIVSTQPGPASLQSGSASTQTGATSQPGTPSHTIASVTSGPATPVSTVRPESSAAQSAPATTNAGKATSTPAPMPGELVPMSKMRTIIAERMVESKRTSAHVHTVFKVDMTRIVKLREKEKSKYEQRNGVKLTYMPFITRAAIGALRKHTIVNAAVEGSNIRYNRSINIGIAVALEWGLIVPVIKQCEEKNFLGIARGIVDIADRARNKKLAPDEVSGGTFTLTNSGIFGEQFGTPVINQPQVAILGIGGLNKEAVVTQTADGDDVISVRSIQRFTLGFDHRIIDGSDAGKFMSDFKSLLENWSEDIG